LGDGRSWNNVRKDLVVEGGACMRAPVYGENKWYLSGVAVAVLVVIVTLSVGCKKSAKASALPTTFASQDEAGKAVYEAARAGDTDRLLLLFGTDAKDLLFSGDAVQDQAARDKFTVEYEQMHRWGKLRNGSLVLSIGAENYPFPFPLLRNSAGEWYFDSNSAKNEILARRIGDNELTTIDVLNAMADAQAEYFAKTHDGSRVRQYAQKFVSDEGKHNGLYWKATDDQPESPLGPLAAYASAEGYLGKGQTPQPFHGYIYRILTMQGERGKSKTISYVIDGNMTGGFAILAYPAQYLNSGVMSFMINQDGVVFQKDLGERTSDIVETMNAFNPDEAWTPVE
jgi:hypothetical protein